MSRDDSGSFLGAYTENEIVKVLADGHHPFASIDQTGVGQLIEIACAKGNKTRLGIKLDERLNEVIASIVNLSLGVVASQTF